MRLTSVFFILLILFSFSSCSNSTKLNIQGEEEAVSLAENMILGLGGKKNWTKLKSVYIRTITRDMQTGDAYTFEEWINLDEPKFMNHRVKDNVHYFQIVNRNDGWLIRNQDVALMLPAGVTSSLNWFNNFFIRNVKLLVLGGENIEVKMNEANAFDMFIDSKYNCGFQLDDNYLPERYLTPTPDKRRVTLNIKKWGDYKGYKYPLVVTGEKTGSYYQTDYWDAGMQDAESSFRVTFDPYAVAENFK